MVDISIMMIMISAFHYVDGRPIVSALMWIYLKTNNSSSRPYKFKETRNTATIIYKFPSTCSVNS